MDKIMNFFVKAISGIIFFAVYIFIVNIASNIYGNGTNIMFDNGNADIFCICIAGVITPVLYFLYMKIFRCDYEKLTDYIPSTVLFFIMCRTMSVNDPSGSLLMYLLVMYVAGNCINFFVRYVISEEKENKHIYSDIIKRILSTVVLLAIYRFLLNDVNGVMTDFWFRVGMAVIITLIFYFISTKFFKISYDNKGLDKSIFIFLIINVIFCLIESESSDNSFFPNSLIEQAFFRVCISVFMYVYICLIAFAIIWICRIIKKKIQGDRAYQQAAEELSSDEEEEKDITDENKPTNGSESYINYNMQKAVLEDMKSFLLDSGNDFILIDEEYHLQAGKDVYYPDMLLYHMKLQCLVALNLKTDDFKAEYLDRMNAYLETLDRDFKKPTDNPSMGIFLCKNEETEVVEYSLNKGLSQEMKDEYETKLIDKKVLKEKLGELYDRAKETNPLFNA